MVTAHILAPKIANVEDLSVEAKPVQIAIDFLADVGLSPCRN